MTSDSRRPAAEPFPFVSTLQIRESARNSRCGAPPARDTQRHEFRFALRLTMSPSPSVDTTMGAPFAVRNPTPRWARHYSQGPSQVAIRSALRPKTTPIRPPQSDRRPLCVTESHCPPTRQKPGNTAKSSCDMYHNAPEPAQNAVETARNGTLGGDPWAGAWC